MINADRIAYCAIRDRIANSHFEPGAQINIRRLAEELKVSPIPVREALIRLAEQDILDLVPGKGVYTKRLSLKDRLIDYELLLTLSKAAYRKLCELPSAYAEALSGFQESMPTSQTNNSEESAALMEHYYSAIFSMLGNDRYWKITQAAVLRTHFIRTIDARLRADSAKVGAKLRLMVRDLLRGDYQSARNELISEYELSIIALPVAHREAVLTVHSRFSSTESASDKAIEAAVVGTQNVRKSVGQ